MDGQQTNSPKGNCVGIVPQSPGVGLCQPRPGISYSPRELEAMALRAQGLTAREIGSRMGVAQSTAEKYLTKGLRQGDVKRIWTMRVGPTSLTARQLVVLRELHKGLEPKQLAGELGCTHQSVSACLRKIRRKLGVPNDIALGAEAKRLGLL